VLIGCPPADLAATAARYLAAKPDERPLLMHPFLPAAGTLRGPLAPGYLTISTT